ISNFRNRIDMRIVPYDRHRTLIAGLVLRNIGSPIVPAKIHFLYIAAVLAGRIAADRVLLKITGRGREVQVIYLILADRSIPENAVYIQLRARYNPGTVSWIIDAISLFDSFCNHVFADHGVKNGISST